MIQSFLSKLNTLAAQLFLAGAALSLSVSQVRAAATGPFSGSSAGISGASKAWFGAQTTVSTKYEYNTFLKVISSRLFGVFFLLIGASSVIFLLWSAWGYLTSNGNPEVIKKSRAGIIAAVIGIILVSLSYWIIGLFIGTASDAASFIGS